MKKKHKSTLVSLIIIMAVIGVSCSYNKAGNNIETTENNLEVSESKDDKNITQESTQEPTQEPTQESPQANNSKTITYTDNHGNKVSFQASEHVVTVDEYHKSEYLLISEVPEEELYLYEHKDKGLILVYGDDAEYILESGSIITPRFILPQMFYSDFDNDGEEEILIDFYIGSGTGISFEELALIEKSTSKDRFFEDMKFFDHGTYTDILSENLEYNVDKEDKITVKFKGDDTTYDFGVVEEARDLDYGSIVHFIVVGNKITIYYDIGVFQYDFASAGYDLKRSIKANVEYSNNEFTLNNFRFLDYSEYSDIRNAQNKN